MADATSTSLRVLFAKAILLALLLSLIGFIAYIAVVQTWTILLPFGFLGAVGAFAWAAGVVAQDNQRKAYGGPRGPKPPL